MVTLGQRIDVDLFLETQDPLKMFVAVNPKREIFNLFYSFGNTYHFLELSLTHLVMKPHKGHRFSGKITNLWTTDSGFTEKSALPHTAQMVEYRHHCYDDYSLFPKIAFYRPMVYTPWPAPKTLKLV
jgi:hypothetical protein